MSGTVATPSRVAEMLDRANGGRRTRIVYREDAAEAVAAVADGSKWSFRGGGSVANAYKYRAYSTVFVVARVDGKVFAAAKVVDAHGSTSPGVAFPELKPWQCGTGPAGDADAKWLAWSKSPYVVELDAVELAAAVEFNG